MDSTSTASDNDDALPVGLGALCLQGWGTAEVGLQGARRVSGNVDLPVDDLCFERVDGV